MSSSATGGDVQSGLGQTTVVRDEGGSVWYVLALALLLRLLFFQPFYLPPDALDYLNSWDGFAEDQAESQWSSLIHFVRLGMMLPISFLRWVSGDSHLFNYIYPLATSLGTVWLTYRMAWRWGGRTAGLIAGGLMAIVPMEVVYGTVLLPDVPLTFFALLACYFSFRAVEENQGRDLRFFLVGLFIGLAYTCKVTALFFFPPAMVQIFFFQRKTRHALALAAGGALVLALEIFGLWVLLGEWHLRIVETLGYAMGSKGNYAHVDQTWSWWLGQIGIKLGGLFWGAHLPTTALLLTMPHLAVFALWRARKMDIPPVAWWLLTWGAVYAAQQLLLSTIEQEPRLFQAALPYFAIFIGLSFADSWRRLGGSLRWGISGVSIFLALCGSLAFWGTHRPSAEVVHALLQDFGELNSRQQRVVIDSPLNYVHRLSHYAGLQNTRWDPTAGSATHWAFIYNRYTAKEGAVLPSKYSVLHLDEGFASPIKEIFRQFAYLPGVGDSSRVVLYGMAAGSGREGGF
jgi:hypothetical protein